MSDDLAACHRAAPGQGIQVACPEDEREALLESAELLNRKMREIRDSGKVVGVDRIAVMAALNLCHEMLQGKSSNLRADERLLPDQNFK